MILRRGGTWNVLTGNRVAVWCPLSAPHRWVRSKDRWGECAQVMGSDLIWSNKPQGLHTGSHDHCIIPHNITTGILSLKLDTSWTQTQTLKSDHQQENINTLPYLNICLSSECPDRGAITHDWSVLSLKRTVKIKVGENSGQNPGQSLENWAIRNLNVKYSPELKLERLYVRCLHVFRVSK